MTSLGFRRGHDHNAARPPAITRAVAISAPEISSTAQNSASWCKCMIPRGFLPTLLYSLFTLSLPILWFYASVDFTDPPVIGTTIGLSALAGLVFAMANDCCCWYNMMLFFHIGVESHVLDRTIAYAQDATDDVARGLSITAVVVIIVHLIPFLLSNRVMLLSLLAYAGVVVNTATIVYVDSTLLLLVLASSLALLSTTMLIGGVCEIRTSLWSLASESMTKKMCITCDGFEL